MHPRKKRKNVYFFGKMYELKLLNTALLYHFADFMHTKPKLHVPVLQLPLY